MRRDESCNLARAVSLKIKTTGKSGLAASAGSLSPSESMVRSTNFAGALITGVVGPVVRARSGSLSSSGSLVNWCGEISSGNSWIGQFFLSAHLKHVPGARFSTCQRAKP